MPNNNQKTDVIPEDEKIWMQLESIFTPQFRNVREKAYNIEKGTNNSNKYNRFVHYTSAEAALKIIKSKRIWMRMC